MSDQKKQEIKQLYRGEVRTADDHLNYLLEKLENKGIREDTLIIVTADHGENLGETDRMGKTRMGHVASASDNLTKVPLVVAHPDLPQAKIENHISIKEIRNIVTNPDIINNSDINDITDTFCEDPVFSQLPAIGNTNFYEKYPDVPKQLFDQHICAGYSKDWKVVQTDIGDQWAWKSGEERDISEAPLELTEGIEQHLEKLVRLDTSKEMVDGNTLSQMKKLGYI